MGIDRKGSAAYAVLSKFKTSHKQTALTALCPSAKVTSYNQKKWIGLGHEICYEGLQSKLEEDLVEWSYSIFVKNHFSGNVTLKMPSRSGVQIWKKGKVVAWSPLRSCLTDQYKMEGSGDLPTTNSGGNGFWLFYYALPFVLSQVACIVTVVVMKKRDKILLRKMV